MAKTVYLVTGANRGIGRAFVSLLLQNPDIIVIATAREASIDAVAAIEREGVVHLAGKLVPLVLDEASTTHASASLLPAIAAIAEQYPDLGLDHLDVVVANAGTSAGFKDVASTSSEDILHDFTVNAVGPSKLFHAVWPLLEKSPDDQRKFVLVTSSVGSIASQDQENFPSTSYGMSKAAANWWAKKVSVEFKDKGLKVGIIHPGWVQTAMGQGIADAVGFPEPPMTVEHSAKQLYERIVNLTVDNSGKFLSHDGTDIPW